jgi:flagellar basal body-associated protein FliL
MNSDDTPDVPSDLDTGDADQTTPKKGMKWWVWLIIGIAIVVVIAIIIIVIFVTGAAG